MKVEFLRKKYPKFIYQKYSYKIQAKNLKISFLFEVPPDLKFEPKIIIKNVPRLNSIPKTAFDNFVFHLGLIEIPSYWKATCSPEILIKAGPLNSQQIKWWKDLILKGMGQFFYENKIDFTQPNFLKIKSLQEATPFQIYRELTSMRFKNRFLVPIGGGKDSIVTLEKLKKQKEKIGCFLVNPTKAMKKIVRLAGLVKNSVIIKRKIDPLLLELNKKGYLNGHTPITAVLAFLSIFVAFLFNYKNIAFSNEKSANEGNLKYLGKTINHQWSKSSEFERKFKNYCQKYLVKGINYFSYLRKYRELEIARMFTQYPQYFSVFSSCNLVLAKKLKKGWCGNCPKCLFVFASLYPFLEKKQLLKIFGSNIFENKKLLPVMKGLLGQQRAKPFECVGTKKESQLIFSLNLKKAQKSGKLPYLLTKIVKNRVDP
jgi:hypothetical protein